MTQQQRDLQFAQRVCKLHENNTKIFSGFANFWGQQELSPINHFNACRYVEASAKSVKSLFAITHDIQILTN